MRFLIIGPMPPPIGGATVLFNQLVNDLRNNKEHQVHIVDTARHNGEGLLLAFLRVITAVIRNIGKVDVVSFHASLQGSLLFSPFLRLICMIYRKPWLFRGFGGNYPVWYKGLSPLKKLIFRKSVLSANLVMLETKDSVEFFKGKIKNRISWYPNSRPVIAKQNFEKPKKRLVFLSQIKPSKGIYILREAMARMPDLSVDCFGPLQEGVTESDFNQENFRYCGVLKPDEVATKLTEYDMLVFPTFYEGEGYPGVILEAFSVGIPVISTKWRCIPEIVDENCGILVEPNDVDSLNEALTKISEDEELLRYLTNGASSQAEYFSSRRWSDEFISECKSLVDVKSSVANIKNVN